MSHIKPPPRYVAYPRGGDYEAPGTYGSVWRPEALRESIYVLRFQVLLLVGTYTVAGAKHPDFFGPAAWLGIAIFIIIPSLLYGAWFARLADAIQFDRIWGVIVGLATALNPFLWFWISNDHLRQLCSGAVPLSLIYFAQKAIVAEAKRYGIAFTLKDTSAIDRMVAYRKDLASGLIEVSGYSIQSHGNNPYPSTIVTNTDAQNEFWGTYAE